jgi:alpha-beta hydrolase superfamily lysophospholipase
MVPAAGADVGVLALSRRADSGRQRPTKEATMPEVHTFVDDGGVTIHYYVWRAARPIGVVQLAHGVGEHARRYEHVAAALTEAGYTVYADDHRGHGQTGLEQWGGDHAKLGRLGVGGLRATIAAVRRFTEIIREAEPTHPLVFIGHSWGSLMGQVIFDRHPDDFDAVVLTGTAYRMPGSMNSGDLNARHKHLGTTGAEWLSRDSAVAAAFAADPLTTNVPLMKLFGVRDALRLVGRPPRSLPSAVPVLIMVGSDDPLGGERSANRLAAAYRRAGVSDVRVIIYEEARHEVFNELNRDEVLSDLVVWLDEKVPVERRTE